MKVNLHPYKIVNLVIIYVLFFGVLIYTALNNNLSRSQAELENFYFAELNNCQITAIKEKAYQGGRGTYKLFTTDCTTEFLPVSAEPWELSTIELYQEGSTISKEPESTQLTISTGETKRTFQIEHFESEDSRPLTLKILGGFLILITAIILLVPNSQYEKWAHNSR